MAENRDSIELLKRQQAPSIVGDSIELLKRQQFIYKFDSGYLRFRKWRVELPFRDALRSQMVVAVADCATFMYCRELSGRNITNGEIESLYGERAALARGRAAWRRVQQAIWGALYLPEYVTVVMESDGDYGRLHRDGFILNGRKYREFNSSASQARVRTVAFVAEDIYGDLMERLNCGRRLEVPMVPAKFSAYLGLACSAIAAVTWPRVAIVPDYEESIPTEVDYVVEIPGDSDDVIERRTEQTVFNRFDGSGLIRPEMAEVWANDLGLDWVPAQFCIRAAFLKGMVTVFDWDEWITDRGLDPGGVVDVYGAPVNLSEVDVILTESQAKLWNSWDSTAHYVRCSLERNYPFGVSLYTPKEDKRHLYLNYQFIQTLNMEDGDIVDLCADTVAYLDGVSASDYNYMKLFLLGEKQNTDTMEAFLKSDGDYWLKSLMVEPTLFNDRYSKQRIRDAIIKRIEQAACGRVMVPGNFQVIVPDSIAFMEALYKLPVVGFLKAGEAYSRFWVDRGVEQVDTMRSPLTNYSEHYIVNIIKENDITAKYFKYSYTGFIMNVHDEHTMRWGGSD